jgi:transcriptional regulator with XRE-family HTH domain
MDFGNYVRQLREQHRAVNRRYSVRQTAHRIGVEPAYLSKIERGDVSPPSEETIRRLAADLGEDSDFLLALAGKVSSDIREIVMKRPILFAEIIRGLSDISDDELGLLVHRVRNGELL